MSPRHRLDALTGLRFLAAAAVALAHLPNLHADASLGPTVRRVLAEGGAGVPFFFILSGFVLAYSYHDRLARPTRGELARYAVSRFARIGPVYLLSVVLIALWPVGPVPAGTAAVAANLLLVQAWPPLAEPVVCLNPVAWSLSVEAFFYVCLPVLLWAAGRRPTAGPGVLAVLAVAAWLVPAGVVLWHSANLGPWSLYVCGLCPAVRLGEFAVGLLLGLGFVRAGGPGAAPPGRRVRLAWTAFEVAAVVLVAVLVFRSHRVPFLLRWNGYYTPALALVVAVFARQRGLLSGLMAARVPVFLGEVSFALFLLHVFVFVHLGRWFGPGRFGSMAQSAVLLAAAVLLSAVVYRCYEAPVRSWLVGLGRPQRKSKETGLLTRLRFGHRAGNVG